MSVRILYETALIVVLVAIPSLLAPALKGIAAMLPIVYLLIERHLRHRPWAAIGFKFREFWPDLLDNWWLVLFVAVISQCVTIFGAKAFLPEFLTHVQARLPLSTGNGWEVIFTALLVATLAEELTYRALFQERLAWFIGAPWAIVQVSLLFAAMHWYPGKSFIVGVDLAFVLVDSLFYGAIFAHSKNILVAWLAHFLADAVGIILLLNV